MIVRRGMLGATAQNIGSLTPLFEPRLIVADFVLQSTADAIHLRHIGAAVIRGAQYHEHFSRPAIIAGEILEVLRVLACGSAQSVLLLNWYFSGRYRLERRL